MQPTHPQQRHDCEDERHEAGQGADQGEPLDGGGVERHGQPLRVRQEVKGRPAGSLHPRRGSGYPGAAPGVGRPRVAPCRTRSSPATRRGTSTSASPVSTLIEPHGPATRRWCTAPARRPTRSSSCSARSARAHPDRPALATRLTESSLDAVGTAFAAAAARPRGPGVRGRGPAVAARSGVRRRRGHLGCPRRGRGGAHRARVRRRGRARHRRGRRRDPPAAGLQASASTQRTASSWSQGWRARCRRWSAG